jgi:hypothetical protein
LPEGLALSESAAACNWRSLAETTCTPEGVALSIETLGIQGQPNAAT